MKIGNIVTSVSSQSLISNSGETEKCYCFENLIITKPKNKNDNNVVSCWGPVPGGTVPGGTHSRVQKVTSWSLHYTMLKNR